MKKQNIICLIVGLALSFTAFSQDNPVIMEVNGTPITKNEFEAIFKKNNKETKVTKEALDEYMDLFINFKLKVADAEANGLDTVQKFKDELNGYRKQLARPYLIDNDLSEELVKQAYDRLGYELRASHILIRCDWEADPKDSLRAYNRALGLRKSILDGSSFEKVATLKTGSEDPTVSKNKGDIGWFTAFQMVYNFEDACYKMKVNEISMPVRTRYGYHIIKLTGKRPARGTIKVAHILVAAKDEDSDEVKANAKKKATEILERIRKGEDFATLANQFSDDPSSSRKGGELTPFSTGKMVQEFEEAAFALEKDGDVSDLVQTAYGFHIIKRLELKGLDSYESMKNSLKQRVQRDSRSQLPRKAFVEKLKKKYGYVEYPKSLNAFYKVVDTTIFYASWDHKKAEGLKEVMFELKTSNHIYKQSDFAKYLFENQKRTNTENVVSYVNAKFNQWANETVIDLEDSNLEEFYPEFALLMKEYRDGILLFELTDQKVWSKAVKDSTGLKAFYEKNKQNYMWPKRYDTQIYYCANAAIAKALNKDLKKNKLDDKALLEKYNKDSQLNLKIVAGKFAIEDNDIIKKYTPTKKGIAKPVEDNGQTIIVKTNAILEPTPKSINEAKGIITSDYQNYLEKEWLDYLKKTYKVVVHKDVLYSIQ